jgi:hypothetical protein
MADHVSKAALHIIYLCSHPVLSLSFGPHSKTQWGCWDHNIHHHRVYVNPPFSSYKQHYTYIVYSIQPHNIPTKSQPTIKTIAAATAAAAATTTTHTTLWISQSSSENDDLVVVVVIDDQVQRKRRRRSSSNLLPSREKEEY